MKDLDLRIEVRMLTDRIKELEIVVRALLEKLNVEVKSCKGMHLVEKEVNKNG